MSKKIGVLLASHGLFAEEALNSLKMILGEVDNISTVSLVPGMNLPDLVSNMENEIEELDTEEGLIIICDIFGGTPSNAAAITLLNADRGDFIAFSGLNLGILLELVNMRNNIEELRETIKNTVPLSWREIEVQKINVGEEEL